MRAGVNQQIFARAELPGITSHLPHSNLADPAQLNLPKK